LRGVPGEIVLGILGVETSFGRITGKYRVIDSLATLAFDFPARSSYFRSELEQLLLLSREEAIDPRTVVVPTPARWAPRNSCRRAIAATRSMPWPTGIATCGTTGRCFREHCQLSRSPRLGERRAGARRSRDRPGARARSRYAQDRAQSDVASLHDKGVRFDTTLAPDAPAMLLAAEQPQGITFRVGFRNFYTLTRYNRSPLYSMTVTDLGAELVKRASTAPEPAAAAAKP